MLSDCLYPHHPCKCFVNRAIEVKPQEKIMKEEKLNQALKFDEGKPDLSQVSYELLEGLAKVRMFGEKKYARDNWKKGFKITRSLSAALRHIFKFLGGDTIDSESGLSHLFHAVACLEHAIWDMEYHKESNDDRFKHE